MSNEMVVTFLGTSSAPPQIKRRQSSIAIKYRGHTLIVDVGEAAQIEMLRHKIGFGNFTILLTHLHSDHTLGLIALLTTRNFYSIKRPITIIGPSWTSSFVGLLFMAYRFKPEYEIDIIETTGGIVLNNKDIIIESFPVKHSKTSIGYKITTHPKRSKFNPTKAMRMHVPKGRLWKDLQEGKSVEINGKKVLPSDVTDPIEPKFLKLVITGDTQFDRDLIDYASKADLLIHDSTYPPDEQMRADKYLHSTCVEAAKIAKEAKVKKLVLTHISELHKNLQYSLEEAKKIFPNSILAEDGLIVKLRIKD